jgi:hypothetical protein
MNCVVANELLVLTFYLCQVGILFLGIEMI